MSGQIVDGGIVLDNKPPMFETIQYDDERYLGIKFASGCFSFCKYDKKNRYITSDGDTIRLNSSELRQLADFVDTLKKEEYRG